MPTKAEPCEYLSLRSSVWGYPMSLGSLSNDPHTGVGEGRTECIIFNRKDAQSIYGDLGYRHGASVTDEKLHVVMSKLCLGSEMKRKRLNRDRRVREGFLEMVLEA